ncbi:S-adenosyl-L-methionine-dependent methyltransferase, partial [Apiospora aurea]
MSGSQTGGDKPIKLEDKSGDKSPAPGDSKTGTILQGGSHGELTELMEFNPDEFLPEDVPVIDPKYLDPDLVSATALPRVRLASRRNNGFRRRSTENPAARRSLSPTRSRESPEDCITDIRKGSKYFLPNDAAEQDRLDLQHRAFTVLLGDRLYLAPIKEPRRVLDLATGTGIWAIDFAREHPQAEVIGTDLSLIQPETALPNVKFIREDVDDPWVFPYKFDYIHARHCLTCFDNPKGVMEQAFQFLEPGGWIEYLDGKRAWMALTRVRWLHGGSLWPRPATDRNMPIGTAIQRWAQLFSQGMIRKGRNPNVAKSYKRWMQEIGFVDAVERVLAAPQGGWAKDPKLKLAGREHANADRRFIERDIYDGVRGISFAMLRSAGMSTEEIDKMVDEVRLDLLSPHVHTYVPIRCVYARKPLDGEVVGSTKDRDP